MNMNPETKYQILKPFMTNGEWYTSERITLKNPYAFTINVSSALALLYNKGYLLRTQKKRIYFKDPFNRTRNYTGKWAYRIKPHLLTQSYTQTKINFDEA
jgi:hypothetical protein